MLLFVYTTTRKRFVIFTCRYFKLSWNTIALSQSNCRNFSCSSLNRVIHHSLLDFLLYTVKPALRTLRTLSLAPSVSVLTGCECIYLWSVIIPPAVQNDEIYQDRCRDSTITYNVTLRGGIDAGKRTPPPSPQGDTQQFYTGGSLVPRSNPFPFIYHFWLFSVLITVSLVETNTNQSALKVDFYCHVISYLCTRVNFTRVNKIEAMYEVSRANILSTRVKFTCAHT